MFSVFSAIADNYKVLNKCTITFLQITFTMQILRQINTSYLTDSYIIFTLKMESVSKNTIFGLKMMVKSGLEKIFLKFLHAGDYFPLLHKIVQNHKFSNKNNYHPA